jgi:hypothetical protein
MLLPARIRVHGSANRISCVNNLKELETAYRIWANDHHDRFPASESVTDGGWREFFTNPNQGFLCWTNYVIMEKEMGQSTKVILCPSDQRKPADTFSNLFSNSNISYFVGVSADQSQPQTLLAGDRHLGRGIKPGDDYGFSPENGLGNDVAIQTNSKADPVGWSLKMHSASNTAGAGNILLSGGNVDIGGVFHGSVIQVTSGSFRSIWQPIAGLTTNWPAGHMPSAPSIRVLFP